MDKYTFPTEARIERMEFTDTDMIFHLEDGRSLSVPLRWIPTLFNATPAERENFTLGLERQSIHWVPKMDAQGRPTAEGVNEDLRLSDFM